jgi:beta-glucanase (GH16 family)
VTSQALEGQARSAGEWRLRWSDEFDGPAGAPPDPAIWRHQLGDGAAEGIPGWGNQELQHYTADPDNASLDGRGSLVLTARRLPESERPPSYNGRSEYSSARLITKGALEVLHGRIETRIRVPRGAGLWPAFWALGTNIDEVGWPACGEIDVVEYVAREPRRVFGTVHGPGYSGDGGITGTLDLPVDVAEDYHVFAVEWEPGLIVWRFDGRPYHRVTPQDTAPSPWVFEQPFYLLLNLAVGGTFGGPVAGGTTFPQSLRVDYVRVFEAGLTG